MKNMRRLLVLLMALILVSVHAFAEEPVEVEFNGTDDWVYGNIKVDNTRPWELEYDIDLESITQYVQADRWADTIELLIRNNDTQHYIEHEIQAYCNNDTRYQIACSAKTWKGSEYSDRPFNWSEAYDSPVTKLHVTFTYDGETFNWLVVNREDEAVMDEFTFNAADVTEGLKAGTNCDLAFYRNPNNLLPDNFLFAYVENVEPKPVDWYLAAKTDKKTYDPQGDKPLSLTIDMVNSEGVRDRLVERYVKGIKLNGEDLPADAFAITINSNGSLKIEVAPEYLVEHAKDGENEVAIGWWEGTVLKAPFTLKNAGNVNAEEVEFSGVDDWINANMKVDNTRPWEIQFDIDFESITKYVLADRWADTIEVLLRNNEAEQHFEYEIQAYCNNDTKYQIACSAKVVSKGADISDRPFNWSANYEAPVTKLHVTLTYDGETFSWLVVNREDDAVMDEFTFNAAEITEELKTCTNCDLAFYRDPKYLVPDTFTFAYTDAQTEE